MKKVCQYRYYGESNSKNNPSSADGSEFVNGSAFSSTMPILQLGIQAVPGTEFYVNGGTEPVVIGITGIYELDLQGEITISSLRFAPSSITRVSESQGEYIIVDVIYEEDD